MTTPKIYRGVWPRNVSRLAKYAVRIVGGEWKITVLYEVEAGLRYLAVEGDGTDIVERINAVKTGLGDRLGGGAFYVNEYRHVLVPVSSHSSGPSPHYYYAGRLQGDLSFEFEGQPLITRPLHPNGTPLNAGERWVGPRPGIPYVLAAGGDDIYYETPALTDENPPRVRALVTQRVKLSKVLHNPALLGHAVRPIANIRGHQGGRFYVNEHGVMFTPVDAGDGNGMDYVYCGQIDRSAWFPEPPIED
ncbi:MAG: hypothetical protein OXL36_12855 [Bryobacterales bacterium]|nr:hypothetical protein [Bryobacterales bacterium]MDE0294180.1 hypothetical protein [Bryobacterales bacterium]